MPHISVAWDRPAADEARYVPSLRTTRGQELALVYIGSARCWACKVEGLADWVEELKLLVQKKANDQGRSFAAIGVAVDWRTEEGIKHLEQFGHFDEVMTGRKWSNIGALKYLYEEFPGLAGTPEVLVVERRLASSLPDTLVSRVSFQDEQLLVRKIGANEIQEWLEQGAPLPLLSPMSESE